MSLGFLADLLSIKGVLLAAIIFMPLQLVVPMHTEQKQFRKGWKNDLIYLFLNSILIRAGLTLAIGLIIAISEEVIPLAFKEWIASHPSWIQVIELIVLADLGFYSAHRLFHTVPFLWRFHAVHHSSENLDWLAAYRVHPVDQILTKGLSLVPCFALGFSEWAIAAFSIIYHWHSLLLHANVKLNLGALRWLVTTPDVHHWHHSNQPEAHNKNYAAQMPLWDLIFGTAYMPKAQRPICYGTSELIPKTYLKQIAYPFFISLPSKGKGNTLSHQD